MTESDYNDPLIRLLPDQISRDLLTARATALAMVKQDQRFRRDNYAKNDRIVSGPDFGGQQAGVRYLPATRRYVGTLYSVPGLRQAIEESLFQSGAPQVLILSALYGPLHPSSPIQDYNLMMGDKPARVWDTIFPLCLEALVATTGIAEIHLLTGTSTAYFRVAKKAVSHLLERRLIRSVLQYHVVDGSTRETPFQHGRLLHSMLTRSPADVSGLQINRLSSGTSYRPPELIQKPVTRETVMWISSAQAQDQRPVTMGLQGVSHALNQATSNGSVLRVSRVPGTAAQEAVPPHSNSPRLQSDIDRFHGLLATLIGAPMQGLCLAELLSSGRLPERGIYFFLDQPINGGTNGQWRICRVGTHAVSGGSKSTLRTRLRAHFGTATGNGNHRGSIFRLHVGNAILQREGRTIPTWGVGSVAPPALRMSDALKIHEDDLERRVSRHIGSLGVLWVDVPDPASPTSERAVIERNSIALLSNGRKPVVQAQSDWLGHHSTRGEIRSSHLWNLKHVDDQYDPQFLEALEQAVERTITSGPWVK